MAFYVSGKPVLAVAPMVGRTDRHCRFFHRQLAPHALLYTEMIVADALLRGNAKDILAFHSSEHPLAIQLGGANPDKLAKAARIAEDAGYDEINLNAGCPSDQVRAGMFGACLMQNPLQAGECVSALCSAVRVPVTVKCRIGVDEQDMEESLDGFAEAVFASGASALWVHARKAWLKGLSPQENRSVPPLNHDRVYRLKSRYPNHFIGVNGGIHSLDCVKLHLSHVDGVMIGRFAYHMPVLLAHIDAFLSFGKAACVDYENLLEIMHGYCAAHVAHKGKLSHVTRHMIHLFSGIPGASLYRRILSNIASPSSCDPQVLRLAFATISLKEMKEP